jgi:hypothetical protein
VLEDVDGALAAVLARQLPEGTTVTFAAPSPGWLEDPPGKQVLSVFLYDIREDPVGRAADWDDVRDERGRVIGRQPPPRRYELSYLVTAWAGDAEQEHRLLSDVLRLVFDGEAIPEDCRVGSLAQTTQPVLLRLVRRDPPHTPAQVWADLGLPPRLVLDLAITAPLVPALVTELAPPAQDMRLGVGRGGPAAFRPEPPPGLRPPDEGGLPQARPDQHWRHRMVDEQAEPDRDGSDPAAPSGTTAGNAEGATGNGKPAGTARPGGRRRLTVTKKED